MSVFEFALTYLVSWWIVLFMVLPFGVKTPENPHPGHAPSAPEKPMLKKKFLITSVLALVPALVIMGIANAQAADGIYTTKGSKCRTLKPYTPPADLAAVDSDATINPQSALKLDSVKMNLDVPAANYLDEEKYNVDLSESQLSVGQLEVKQDGTTTFNGQAVGGGAVYEGDCKNGE